MLLATDRDRRRRCGFTGPRGQLTGSGYFDFEDARNLGEGHVEAVMQDEGNALSGSKGVQDDEGSKTILFLRHDVLQRIGCR